MSDWPPYLTRPKLLEYLDICDRTLDGWLAKGFPRHGRHNKWSRAKVDRYMDGDDAPAVAFDGGQPDRDVEEIKNASQAYFARH